MSLLYDNPNRDSRLELVGGDGERIVFVEDNTRVFGRGRWKMWYLDHPGAAAKLIDEGAGKLPFFDVAGTSLVWTTMAGQQSESQLWLLDLATMDRRLLVSEDSAVTQYWFPSIDGDLVAYATLELAPDGRSEVRHVYLLDVDDVAPPRQLDATGTASMPEINGDTVVWKESSLQFSHVNAGRLVRYSLASGGIEPLTLNPHSFRYPGGDLYTFPSIGSRYVAAWSGYDRALYLADLKTGAPLEILDLGPSDDDHHASVGLIADLTGDLLAYLYGPANEGDLELRWVVLRD